MAADRLQTQIENLTKWYHEQMTLLGHLSQTEYRGRSMQRLADVIRDKIGEKYESMLRRAALGDDIADPHSYVPVDAIQPVSVLALTSGMTFCRNVMSGDQQKMDTSFNDFASITRVARQLYP